MNVLRFTVVAAWQSSSITSASALDVFLSNVGPSTPTAFTSTLHGGTSATNMVALIFGIIGTLAVLAAVGGCVVLYNRHRKKRDALLTKAVDPQDEVLERVVTTGCAAPTQTNTSDLRGPDSCSQTSKVRDGHGPLQHAIVVTRALEWFDSHGGSSGDIAKARLSSAPAGLGRVQQMLEEKPNLSDQACVQDLFRQLQATARLLEQRQSAEAQHGGGLETSTGFGRRLYGQLQEVERKHTEVLLLGQQLLNEATARILRD